MEGWEQIIVRIKGPKAEKIKNPWSVAFALKKTGVIPVRKRKTAD